MSLAAPLAVLAVFSEIDLILLKRTGSVYKLVRRTVERISSSRLTPASPFKREFWQIISGGHSALMGLAVSKDSGKIELGVMSIDDSPIKPDLFAAISTRSEERRGGKEC